MWASSPTSCAPLSVVAVTWTCSHTAPACMKWKRPIPTASWSATVPGDPEQADRAIDTVRDLIGRRPLMGVCLGTPDSWFGNRCHDQPPPLRPPRRQPAHQGPGYRPGSHITSQNHGFQVDAASIPRSSGFRVSHVNLNDGSVEGLAHDSLAGLFGPIPPGSQPRAAGQPVPIRPFPRPR